MTTLGNLKADCLQRIEQARRDALRIYGIDLQITTAFKRGMGRWAGKAQVMWGVRTGMITINLDALELDQTHVVNETCPHEVAHIVAFALKVDRGHGRAWKNIAKALGCQGETYHDIPLKPRGGGHLYRATCGTEIVLSTVLHNRVQQGRTRTVTKTKGLIKPEGYVGKA